MEGGETADRKAVMLKKEYINKQTKLNFMHEEVKES